MLNLTRFALGSYHYLRYPLDYFLNTAVDLGLSTVELWAAAPQLWLDSIKMQSLKLIRRQLRERDLNVCCITPEQVSYPINIAAEDIELRSYSIRNFAKAIEVAYELESPLVLVTAGCGFFNHSIEEAWERSCNSLYLLAEIAKKRGIRLALETLTPMSSNILNTPEQQKKMIGLLPSESTCAVLDIGQMVYMNQDISRYLDLGNLLGHVHIHDSHPGIHMALGDGDLPLHKYLNQVEKSGYSGTYAFEFNDIQYRIKPREADLRSINWLRECSLSTL